jgi:hypothetical protein
VTGSRLVIETGQWEGGVKLIALAVLLSIPK